MLDVDKILEQYPFPTPPAEWTPLGSVGGMSGAQFWRIALPERVLILRRWPTEHPSPERLRFIHAVLQHAAAHDCNFLPLPLTTRTGKTFVVHDGYLWELAPWLPGIADYATTPSPAKLSAAMRALATFHNATASIGAFSVGRQTESKTLRRPSAIHRHLTRLQELTPRHLNELAHSIRDDLWPDLAPLSRQFLAAVPNEVPLAIAQLEALATVALPLQPCLRDIWHDHVLFTGNEVTGLVDFGAIAIDTPATDIARLVGSLADLTPLPFREGQGEGSGTVPFSRVPMTSDTTSTGDAPQSTAKRGLSPSAPDRSQRWQQALAAYNTIRSLTENETRAAHALSTSAPIVAGCNWLRWIHIDGREFENHSQVIERFRHIVANL